MQDKDLEFLHDLLYWALIEIREETSDTYPKSFALSNLLHNLPHDLLRAHSCEQERKRIVKKFVKMMSNSRYKKWVTDHGEKYKDTEIMRALESPLRVDHKTDDGEPT